MKYNEIILESPIPANFLKQAVKYVYNNNNNEQLIYHVKWYAEHECGQEEEEWRVWRIAAENNTMKWRRAAKNFLEERVIEIYDKITWLGRSGRIEIWREITAPKNWKPTDDYQPGFYWSWDQAAAEAHWGNFESGNATWTLFTTVPMSFVNLFNTVVKNADLSIGDEEREIELKDTRPFPYKAIMKDNPKIHYDYIPKNKIKLPYFTEQKILETPITNWEIDQNFDYNEKKLQDRFVGYDREQLSYSPQDKFGIKSKKNIAKIKQAFLHVPYNINLYFYQPTDPNYDNYMQQGVVDYKWILINMGENVVDYMKKTSNANSITIILTNNLSEEFKISLKSPWIMAHRISHTLINGANHIENGMKFHFQFEEFIERVVNKVYGYKLNNWHHVMKEEEIQIFGKMLGEIMGTMSSARNKKLVNYYEWIYESFAQYLINGKIKFNKILPLHFDEGMDSTPEKIAMGARMIARFEGLVNKISDKIMKEAVGKIFVM